MITVSPRAGHTLTLTGEEREEILALVEHSLGELSVERRRTEVLSYQKEVRREESVPRAVLEKLRCSTP